MTTADNGSSGKEKEALPMQMDSSNDEVSVHSTHDDAIAVTEGVDCTLCGTFLEHDSPLLAIGLVYKMWNKNIDQRIQLLPSTISEGHIKWVKILFYFFICS